MIRSCMAAFTPETASPSFFRTDLSCALIRIFTFAITVGASWNPGEAISLKFLEGLKCSSRKEPKSV